MNKKPYPRKDRVASLLKRAMVEVLRLHFDAHEVGMVTLLDIVLTRDLRQATIQFTVFGDDAMPQRAEELLNKAAPYLRAKLAERVQIRVPSLHFRYDDSFLKVHHVAQLIEQYCATEEPEKTSENS